MGLNPDVPLYVGSSGTRHLNRWSGSKRQVSAAQGPPFSFLCLLLLWRTFSRAFIHCFSSTSCLYSLCCICSLHMAVKFLYMSAAYAISKEFWASRMHAHVVAWRPCGPSALLATSRALFFGKGMLCGTPMPIPKKGMPCGLSGISIFYRPFIGQKALPWV